MGHGIGYGFNPTSPREQLKSLEMLNLYNTNQEYMNNQKLKINEKSKENE